MGIQDGVALKQSGNGSQKRLRNQRCSPSPTFATKLHKKPKLEDKKLAGPARSLSLLLSSAKTHTSSKTTFANGGTTNTTWAASTTSSSLKLITTARQTIK